MYAHQTAVLPMEEQELREVIEKPAALPDVRLSFEQGLVELLLTEMQRQRQALPLLQFMLDSLYQHRDGETLTVQCYRDLGGLKGVISQQAEKTYQALPSDEHRQIARYVFLRLLLINSDMTEQETMALARRRVALANLEFPHDVQNEQLHTVLNAFVQARLLTINRLDTQITLEVSHEAVFWGWTTLSNWVKEETEAIVFQQTLSRDIVEWEQHGKPKDRLYHGSKLRDARNWAQRHLPSMQEEAFLRASVSYQKRARTIRIAPLLMLVGLLGALLIWTSLQIHMGQQMALSRQLLVASNLALLRDQPDLALLLSVKAWQANNSQETRDTLLSTLVDNPHMETIWSDDLTDGIIDMAVYPDGQSFLTLDSNGTVERWDVKTQQHHPFFHGFIHI
jgi:hypothetical protein